MRGSVSTHFKFMQKIYDIREEALREGESHPYYHNMFMRIQEEMHPVTELQIVWTRRRDKRRVS